MPDAQSDLLDGIISLAEKGLLQPLTGSASESRFGMLETIREYGREQMARNGEAAGVGAAHVAYFLRFSTEGREQTEGPARLSANDRIRNEAENLHAALDWALVDGDAETAHRLACEMARFWVNLGDIPEGRAWLERAMRSLDRSCRPRASRRCTGRRCSPISSTTWHGLPN